MRPTTRPDADLELGTLAIGQPRPAPEVEILDRIQSCERENMLAVLARRRRTSRATSAEGTDSDDAPPSSRDGWDESAVRMLLLWERRMWQCAAAHHRQATLHQRVHRLTEYPNIICSVALTVLTVYMDPSSSTGPSSMRYMSILLAVLVSVILLSKRLYVPEFAYLRHQMASRMYSGMCDDMELQFALPPSRRMPLAEFVLNMHQRRTRLLHDSPHIEPQFTTTV